MSRSTVITLLALLVISIGTRIVEHKLRQTAQSNETLYSIMLNLDAASFMLTGGDPIGYSNQFKWNYAQWVTSPNRSIIEKLLFWDRGIFYDASHPPAEYPYPKLFEDSA